MYKIWTNKPALNKRKAFQVELKSGDWLQPGQCSPASCRSEELTSSSSPSLSSAGSSSCPSVSSLASPRTESPENTKQYFNAYFERKRKTVPRKSKSSVVPVPLLEESDVEIVNFLKSEWNEVMKEYQTAKLRGNSSFVFYQPENSVEILKDFKPFDLEKWYVQRMLDSINIHEVSVSTSCE